MRLLRQHADLQRRYLEAVRDSLLGVHIQTPSIPPSAHKNASELERLPFSADDRARGTDWPLFGLSMIGAARMNSLWHLLEDVLDRSVPGSFVECGVWRGGASIFARAVFQAHGTQREVHLVDSFQDDGYWSEMGFLRVPLEEVRAGFERFGLLDSFVTFHKGFFRYSLPAWRSQGMSPIAVLRMDGDMYESTMDQLYNLWDAVSPGGWVVVDDYSIPPCAKALHEFAQRHELQLDIQQIDGSGAFFQKPPGQASPIDQSWYLAWNASRSTADA